MFPLEWREVAILACIAGLWLYLLRGFLPGARHSATKRSGT